MMRSKTLIAMKIVLGATIWLTTASLSLGVDVTGTVVETIETEVVEETTTVSTNGNGYFQCRRPNKEYLECGTACPLQCGKPVPDTCITSCRSGCFCKQGYCMNANGSCSMLNNYVEHDHSHGHSSGHYHHFDHVHFDDHDEGDHDHESGEVDHDHFHTHEELTDQDHNHDLDHDHGDSSEHVHEIVIGETNGTFYYEGHDHEHDGDNDHDHGNGTYHGHVHDDGIEYAQNLSNGIYHGHDHGDGIDDAHDHDNNVDHGHYHDEDHGYDHDHNHDHEEAVHVDGIETSSGKKIIAVPLAPTYVAGVTVSLLALCFPL